MQSFNSFVLNLLLLGYVITITSLVLNFLDGNKEGIALVLLSWGAAYFADTTYLYGKTMFSNVMQFVSIAACALSLAVWYF